MKIFAHNVADLSFIGTDPLHVRRGAGSLMLQWAKEQCNIEGTLAYLESTVEAASFYEKNGFRAVQRLSLDIVGDIDTRTIETYEEICYLFEPRSTTI